MRWDIPNITILEVIEASELFSSRSDIRRNVAQDGIRMNGILVEDEDLNEPLVVGDFINLFMDGRGLQLSKSFGTHQLILIERGKRKKALLEVGLTGTGVLN